MENKIIYLNLDLVELYGWERYKSDKVIDYMIRSMEAMDSFPPVPVVRISDFMYELTDVLKVDMEPLDGGHNRAVAHYIAGRPLKCKVVGSQTQGSGWKFVNIRNIVIHDDRLLDDCFERLRKIDGNYRRHPLLQTI